MFEPKLTDAHPESAKTYPQTVFCSRHNCEAQVVIANWPFSEEGWSDWRVIDSAKWERGASRVKLWDIVDCPLLPAGKVWCDKRCLDQLEDEDRPK